VTSTPRRTTSALAAGLAGSLLVGLLGGSSVAAPRETLFPGQGNAGYQVRAYDVSIDYQPTTNRAIATVRIRAVARTALRSFHLDFDGPRVTSVVVDGQPARSTREGTELVVTPSAVVDAGRFSVTVSYDGRPPEVVDADGSTEGWVRTTDGAIAINEPVGAMSWLPSNNTPGDKARFTYRLSAPAGYSAVANGELVETAPHGTGTTWTWRQEEPMSTFLAVVGFGRYDVVESSVTSVDGRRLPLWFFEDSLVGASERAREVLPEVIAFCEELFGPYPFSSGGHVVDDAYVGYALETQGRPFYPPDGADTSTVVHETAHQWFGNSVTLTDWHDIWLAEGFATYAEWMWSGARGGRTPQEHFEALYSRDADDDLWSPAPVRFTDPADLFGEPVYARGAMTLHALRREIGTRDFLALARRWAADFAYDNVRTRDLERLAEKVSGEQLDELFDDWLRRDGKPRGY
jgi:aminopeptidase N